MQQKNLSRTRAFPRRLTRLAVRAAVCGAATAVGSGAVGIILEWVTHK